MNKTIAITTIAMFAVVLGVSAFAPAFAARNNTAAVCHLGGQTTVTTADDIWTVILVNTNGTGDKDPLTAHLKHGDYLIPNQSTVANCLNQTPGL